MYDGILALEDDDSQLLNGCVDAALAVHAGIKITQG